MSTTKKYLLGSLLAVTALLAIMLLSNPTQSIKPVTVFFGVLLVGSFCFFRGIFEIFEKWTTPEKNRRSGLVAAFITAAVMLNTTGNASSVELITLVVILTAWLFYSEYRSKKVS